MCTAAINLLACAQRRLERSTGDLGFLRSTLVNVGAPWNKPSSPGWYPDPSGQPAERYHNGVGWTVHRRESVESPPTTPIPRAAAQPPLASPAESQQPTPARKERVKSARSGRLLNRILAIVAICAFGGWLGVWILLALTAFLN